ncbi:MAG: hypothetical protein ACI4IQ_03425 [Eubacterium sp.]
MSWREIYESKLVTAEEAIKVIKDGDKVVTGFGCGEPFAIERVRSARLLSRNFQDNKMHRRT